VHKIGGPCAGFHIHQQHFDVTIESDLGMTSTMEVADERKKNKESPISMATSYEHFKMQMFAAMHLLCVSLSILSSYILRSEIMDVLKSFDSQYPSDTLLIRQLSGCLPQPP
jgi:hypothetical protein